MKLTLIDFKCYHNKTFDLGSSGITVCNNLPRLQPVTAALAIPS